ncbi:MAG: hypothetical protein J6P03_05885 [Opitutales bacterium]|nr:hypothetical protein [Alphaproteobacteria bacterium]MBO6102765.1 hypothetical protein [Opitutales bacterium]MBP5699158.1 hypothetical protein [Alphaproteobacteria bacterium]
MTQAEKLVKIIMPDLLRYLKLKERGLVCQNRVLQRIPLDQREKKEEEFEEFSEEANKILNK